MKRIEKPEFSARGRTGARDQNIRPQRANRIEDEPRPVPQWSRSAGTGRGSRRTSRPTRQGPSTATSRYDMRDHASHALVVPRSECRVPSTLDLTLPAYLESYGNDRG